MCPRSPGATGAGLKERGKARVRKEKIIWSSEYRFMVDAWEPEGEEGRGKLR